MFLTPGTGIAAHRAEVGRLMVRPDLQECGWGTVSADDARDVHLLRRRLF